MKRLSWVLLLLLCGAVARGAEVERDLSLYRVALSEWLERRGSFPEPVAGARTGPYDVPANALYQQQVAKLDRKLTASTVAAVARLLADFPNEFRGWALLGRMLEQDHKVAAAERAYGRFVELLVRQVTAPPGSPGSVVSLDAEVQLWAGAEKEVLVWAETEAMDAATRRQYELAFEDLQRAPHDFADVVGALVRTSMRTGVCGRITDHYREAQRHQARFVSSILDSTRGSPGSLLLATGFADYFFASGDLTSGGNLVSSVMRFDDWRLAAVPYLSAESPVEAIPLRPDEPELFRMEVERLLEIGQESQARALHAAKRASYTDTRALAELDARLKAAAAPAGRMARAVAASRAGRCAEALALLKESRAAGEAGAPAEELEVLCRPLWMERAGRPPEGVDLAALRRDAGPASVAERRYWRALTHGERDEADRICVRELGVVPLRPVWVLAHTFHLVSGDDKSAVATWLARARAGLRYTGGQGWLLAELAVVSGRRVR